MPLPHPVAAEAVEISCSLIASQNTELLQSLYKLGLSPEGAEQASTRSTTVRSDTHRTDLPKQLNKGTS